MILEVETLLAASLMMAVFSAVAAVGTSIVLGAGFERLRAGFEVISKQTGFFSDAIHKLEEKYNDMDQQTVAFSENISQLETKVTNVGEQSNVFSDTIKALSNQVNVVNKQTEFFADNIGKLEQKIDIVDRQSGFFTDSLNKLEKKIDMIDTHTEIVSDKIERHANTDLISTGKSEALVSHAEDLLIRMTGLASQMEQRNTPAEKRPSSINAMNLSMPKNLTQHVFHTIHEKDPEEIIFH